MLATFASLAGVLVYGDYRTVVIFSPALVGLATAALLLLITLRASDERGATSPTLRWFGTISYGLYLIHQPINGLFHGLILNERPDVGTTAQIVVTILAAGASIALAWLSWRWFEKPILDFSKHTRMSPSAPAHLSS
jgi:peptidoglycan/LPS O-acetylase OafA/YrhL